MVNSTTSCFFEEVAEQVVKLVDFYTTINHNIKSPQGFNHTCPFTNHDFFFIELFMPTLRATVHIALLLLVTSLILATGKPCLAAAPPLVIEKGVDHYQAGINLDLFEDPAGTDN